MCYSLAVIHLNSKCTLTNTFKANSHIHVPCRSPAMPFRSGFKLCLSHLNDTVRRVWFTRAMPFPCHATNMPFWRRPRNATAGSRQGNGMGTAWERHGMCESALNLQFHSFNLHVFAACSQQRNIFLQSPISCLYPYTRLPSSVSTAVRSPDLTFQTQTFHQGFKNDLKLFNY
jgi:hypothetical protein